MQADQNGRLLLLVDDDEYVRRVFIRIARSRGITILEACDSARAIELAREHSPDLIILDMSLPGASGLQTLQELRNVARTASIPVIMSSGSITEQERERAFQLGASDCLLKPFDIYRFFDSLDQIILEAHRNSSERSGVMRRATTERETSLSKARS